ncbi:MAG TPA: hypothetical protein VOA87_16100 [Thermoanaerobaculia bacterium]|nr:hypothetical protein [Thermoanaerobaculia bacterium]
MNPPPTVPPRSIVFDSTPEIFATDSQGSFTYPLLVAGSAYVATSAYDEVRFVFSLWHPSGQRTIDLDRAYVELRASFDSEEEHWTKIAEIEPVVPPYAGGESFDGWIVLPILGGSSAFAIVGSGFEPRARLQIRASAYFVA